MTLNKTNWEHAGIAAAIQFFLTMATCVFWTPSAAIIILAALPGLFLFFGREHAQRTEKLKKDYKASTITWPITLEALHVWEWGEDARVDFLLPVALTIPQVAGQWLLWVK